MISAKAGANMNKIIKKTDLQGKTGISSKPSAGGLMPVENGGVLNRKVLDAKEKAQLILDDASREAEKIREEARGLLSKVKEETEKARRDGFERGREEGLLSVTEMLTALEAAKERFYERSEPEMIKLVIAIAEKVIGRMVREHEEAIKSIVRQAVDSSLGDRITVRLNPEDHRIVTSDGSGFKEILDRTKRIVFKEDEAVTKGGCVVETEVGTIDARLETQLKAIRKALAL